MNSTNIAELEAGGYKYIIGARIKNESEEARRWILSQPKVDRQMVSYDKGGGRRLLVGYTDDRAKKDAYNRDKGIRRLEKAYRRGTLTKSNINRRGYNKFLAMDGEVKVTIDLAKVDEDKQWDGLKGISMSIDKVLALAATVTTIQIELPLNKEIMTQTMLMQRHQRIAKLFDENFWVTQ